MVNEETRKRLPPYVSYRTFQNFVDRLQQRMPSRIDRSYWGDMFSGSSGIQLMATLHYLKLIDNNGQPSAVLKPLVSATGEQRQKLLREIATEAFGFVLRAPFDQENATYAQLQEVFYHTFQVTGDVNRKCIKFFIALATDAGIPLSPFIMKRTRSAGTRSITKKAINRTNRNLTIPQHSPEITEHSTLDKMLLSKFPAFDPNWSDELKLKWFEAFDELLKRSSVQSNK